MSYRLEVSSNSVFNNVFLFHLINVSSFLVISSALFVNDILIDVGPCSLLPTSTIMPNESSNIIEHKCHSKLLYMKMSHNNMVIFKTVYDNLTAFLYINLYKITEVISSILYI